MGILDKDRKRLWAKSGNRCAICKHELFLTKTMKISTLEKNVTLSVAN